MDVGTSQWTLGTLVISLAASNFSSYFGEFLFVGSVGRAWCLSSIIHAEEERSFSSPTATSVQAHIPSLVNLTLQVSCLVPFFQPDTAAPSVFPGPLGGCLMQGEWGAVPGDPRQAWLLWPQLRSWVRCGLPAGEISKEGLFFSCLPFPRQKGQAFQAQTGSLEARSLLALPLLALYFHTSPGSEAEPVLGERGAVGYGLQGLTDLG